MVIYHCSGLQITAEQILRESQALQEQDFKPPTQKVTDPTELAEYRLRKRKEFEDLVRRVRWNQSVWVKVARSCSICCVPDLAETRGDDDSQELLQACWASCGVRDALGKEDSPPGTK